MSNLEMEFKVIEENDKVEQPNNEIKIRISDTQYNPAMFLDMFKDNKMASFTTYIASLFYTTHLEIFKRAYLEEDCETKFDLVLRDDMSLSHSCCYQRYPFEYLDIEVYMYLNDLLEEDAERTNNILKNVFNIYEPTIVDRYIFTLAHELGHVYYSIMFEWDDSDAIFLNNMSDMVSLKSNVGCMTDKKRFEYLKDTIFPSFNPHYIFKPCELWADNFAMQNFRYYKQLYINIYGEDSVTF